MSKPFHSRIFRIYLEYAREELKWSERQVSDFLDSIPISVDRLNDDATWLDLEFCDRFFDRIVEVTGIKNIAYEAGLFVHKKTFSPIVHQLLTSLLSVESVYKASAKYAVHFSKAAKVKALETKNGSATIESIPEDGIPERQYMCENRMGIYAGVPKMFGLAPGLIEHPECVHRGNRRCLYQVRWTPQRQVVIETTAIVATIIFSLLGWLFMDWRVGTSTFVIGAALLSVLYYRKRYQSQKQDLLNQNESLSQALSEIEHKNNQLAVVGKISGLTHQQVKPDALAKTVVENVCSLLGYDRSILLIADFHRHVLGIKAFHGFDARMSELLSQTEFNLDSDNTSGFFVRVVNTKQPLLLSSVEEKLDHLSPRSRRFAKTLGSQSFVAVPLLDIHKNAVGVLAVDYVDSRKKLTVSDQDLLMTLADHLAIALHNTKILDQLEENLQTARQFSMQQQVLRESFQKFVPTEVANSLMTVADDQDDYQRQLQLVRKKSVAVIFCDIFNFSGIADKLEPEFVVDFLNTCFRQFEPCISRNHGYIEKFVGDGFIAVFDTVEASLKASHAACELIGQLPSVNVQLHEKKYPSVELGIGINSGNVILGNVGSSNRLNFTVIGDTVNVASRLENHTRALGPNTICTSASVKNQTPADLFIWKDLGHLQLKGIGEGVHAFQLVSNAKDLNNPSFQASTTSDMFKSESSK